MFWCARAATLSRRGASLKYSRLRRESSRPLIPNVTAPLPNSSTPIVAPHVSVDTLAGLRSTLASQRRPPAHFSARASQKVLPNPSSPISPPPPPATHQTSPASQIFSPTSQKQFPVCHYTIPRLATFFPPPPRKNPPCRKYGTPQGSVVRTWGFENSSEEETSQRASRAIAIVVDPTPLPRERILYGEIIDWAKG
jgi:hypothetical protein